MTALGSRYTSSSMYMLPPGGTSSGLYDANVERKQASYSPYAATSQAGGSSSAYARPSSRGRMPDFPPSPKAERASNSRRDDDWMGRASPGASSSRTAAGAVVESGGGLLGGYGGAGFGRSTVTAPMDTRSSSTTRVAQRAGSLTNSTVRLNSGSSGGGAAAYAAHQAASAQRMAATSSILNTLAARSPSASLGTASASGTVRSGAANGGTTTQAGRRVAAAAAASGLEDSRGDSPKSNRSSSTSRRHSQDTTSRAQPQQQQPLYNLPSQQAQALSPRGSAPPPSSSRASASTMRHPSTGRVGGDSRRAASFTDGVAPPVRYASTDRPPRLNGAASSAATAPGHATSSRGRDNGSTAPVASFTAFARGGGGAAATAAAGAGSSTDALQRQQQAAAAQANYQAQHQQYQQHLHSSSSQQQQQYAGHGAATADGAPVGGSYSQLLANGGGSSYAGSILTSAAAAQVNAGNYSQATVSNSRSSPVAAAAAPPSAQSFYISQVAAVQQPAYHTDSSTVGGAHAGYSAPTHGNKLAHTSSFGSSSVPLLPTYQYTQYTPQTSIYLQAGAEYLQQQPGGTSGGMAGHPLAGQTHHQPSGGTITATSAHSPVSTPPPREYTSQPAAHPSHSNSHGTGQSASSREAPGGSPAATIPPAAPLPSAEPLRRPRRTESACSTASFSSAASYGQQANGTGGSGHHATGSSTSSYVTASSQAASSAAGTSHPHPPQAGHPQAGHSRASSAHSPLLGHYEGVAQVLHPSSTSAAPAAAAASGSSTAGATASVYSGGWVREREPVAGAGCVGLQNLGNTCYMNSVLQSLNAVPELVAWFQRAARDGGPPGGTRWGPKAMVGPAYADFVAQVWNAQYQQVVSPSAFCKKVARQDSRWGDGSQQDAQEFLHSLLSTLQTECNRVEGKPTYKQLEGKGTEEQQADEAAEYARSWNDSVIDDVFGGLLQSTITCHVCRKQSHCFDPFHDLAVPIPAAATTGGAVSLQDCLKAFTEVEKLEGTDSYKCEHCKKCVPHSKRLQVYRLPRLLVLTLKRFSAKGTAGGIFSRFRSASKNTTAVALEVDRLDMSPYSNPLGQRSGGGRHSGGRPGALYQLISVSHHSGSLEGGHYTAQGRSFNDNQWYNFNDTSVRKDSRPSGPSSSAYVLIYRLIDESSL